MVARQTWLSVMVLRMVRQSKYSTVNAFLLFVAFQLLVSLICPYLLIISVTGLHDMDEFVQSQLILAVSANLFIVCLIFMSYFSNLYSDKKSNMKLIEHQNKVSVSNV